MSPPHASLPAPDALTLRRVGLQYVKVQLVYNPLLVGGAVLALSDGDFGYALASSLTIAAVASSVSFVPVVLALALGALRRRQGHAPATHDPAWYFALALLTMPLGLYLAGTITRSLFGARATLSVGDYRFGIFLGTLIAASFFAWQTRADARARLAAAELRAERAERLEVEAQLAGLRAQLDPHLLFNALNSVAALIPSEPDAAERTLLRLAELYRGLLAASRCELHTLERELDICRAYLDVERVRFAERIECSIEVAGGLDASQHPVPVLVLQPLVENAIRHGLAARARGGVLRVRARSAAGALELEVEDDGVGIGNSGQRGAGLALETLRQRLSLRYGSAAALEVNGVPSGGTRALVRLPCAPAHAPGARPSIGKSAAPALPAGRHVLPSPGSGD